MSQNTFLSWTSFCTQRWKTKKKKLLSWSRSLNEFQPPLGPPILSLEREQRWVHCCRITGFCVCLMLLCAQSCLLCDPVNYSPPGLSVHGIFQARILEWVAMPSSRGSSWPRDWTCVSCIGRRILYPCATLYPWVWVSEVTQSCPTLCDPVDCSPPGSSVHGILQARVLEWVAISFSNPWVWGPLNFHSTSY